MTPERWQRIRPILDRALELQGEERATFLRERCDDDAALRADVDTLLRAEARGGPPLDAPVAEYADALVAELADARSRAEGGALGTGLGAASVEQPEFVPAGKRVGPWRIVRELGRGGMAIVYLAERADGAYEQQVALKLLQGGPQAADLVSRFERERQILASLEHRHIARLVDGGLTADGQPWFAMEYVEGEHIDRFCDRRRLTVEERLELFVQIARAVQAAHRALVVHRDLKPSNILVNAEGEPRLLDFGIAKPLDTEASATAATGTVLMLTPDYASPEQVRGAQATTASDVYQLGLLLYELLTGMRAQRVARRSSTELERVVIERTPPPPSTAARTGDAAAARGDARRTTAPELARRLSGDIDAIILQALRKEPERRYGSAAELADDVRRHLASLPVTARPDFLWYRARKFVHRHALGMATAAGFVLLVAALVAFYTLRLQEERDQARIEAAKAQAAQDYLVELFEAADPAQARGETITVQEVVQRGIARLDEDLEAQPEVHVEMLKVLGRVEQGLGDFDLSTKLLEQALTGTRELRGEEHLDVAEAAALLGEAFRWSGEWDRAESLLREALTIRRRLIQGDDPDVAINIDRLARTIEMQGDLEEAETLYREALAMRERLFGESSDAVAANLNNLGWLLHEMGKMDEAEEALRRSLVIKEERLELPSPHPKIASNMSNLAVVLREQGKYGEAEHYFVQALEQERKLHGEDHPRFATALNNLALLHMDMARYGQAARLFRQVLENDRTQLGPEHAYVGVSLGYLAAALAEDGRSAEAAPLLEEMLAIFRNTVGEEHRYYARGLMFQGDALYYRQEPGQAVAVLERSVDTFRRAVGGNHPDLARALARLGRARLVTGDVAAAETALREALEIQQQALPSPHTETAWTLTLLGRALTELSRTDEAESLLREAVEASTLALHPGHWRRIAARLELAVCLTASGAGSAARAELEQALAALRNRTDFHARRLLSRARELQNRVAE